MFPSLAFCTCWLLTTEAGPLEPSKASLVLFLALPRVPKWTTLGGLFSALGSLAFEITGLEKVDSILSA